MEVGQPMDRKELVILIPCRLNSRRLSKKALRVLSGDKTLIQMVYENTYKALRDLRIDSSAIFVCTDSLEIQRHLNNLNIPCLLTSEGHKNGTERISECLDRYEINAKFIIDVQGDEPFVSSSMIKLVLNSLEELMDKHQTDPVIVVPHQIIGEDEASRESTVKIVTDKEGRVLYMSRYPIPYIHKPSPDFVPSSYKKHLSVIGFNRSALIYYSQSPQSHLEKLEDIELMRALEADIHILSPYSPTSTFSIDTLEDFEMAKTILNTESSMP